ncbi:zf-HC2 domain-containing protein [Streptomyces sp. NPDC059740]|uniref:zf-HC2 domain-containing protein n=1 Tax=Streptomyces sp. NPDC059740 TaxID=3346926 RepID=UPI00364BA81D
MNGPEEDPQEVEGAQDATPQSAREDADPADAGPGATREDGADSAAACDGSASAGDASSTGNRPRIPAPRTAPEDLGQLPDATPPPTAPEPSDPPRPEPAEALRSDPGGATHGAGPENRRPERTGPQSDRAADKGPHDREPESGEPEGNGPQEPANAPAPPSAPTHRVLKSLLGAYALGACSPEETAALEDHLTHCAPCADEALRLRNAVSLLRPADHLDPDPLLRARVLEGCLDKRPARIPVPEWAGPFDAESAKLDALLRDIGEAEWRAPVRLRWFDGRRTVERETTVAGVVGHLLAVDGIVASALGMPDPLGALNAVAASADPADRTERYWQEVARRSGDRAGVREPWRAQAYGLVRTVSFAAPDTAERDVPVGPAVLPVRDAFLDRAFECYTHAGDIADAVAWPLEPPTRTHMHRLVDFAARLLPTELDRRRRAGLASPARHLRAVGGSGRSLHLEVENVGHWYIALDSADTDGSPDATVAHIAIDSQEFCQLAAGHVAPEEATAGRNGEREAIRDVLFATASLSRL